MVDRDTAEHERHAVAERVGVDAEADAQLVAGRQRTPATLTRRRRARRERAAIRERVAADRAGVALQPPPGPRRRWTATSPAASAGSDVVVDPVADVRDLAGGDARELDEARRRTPAPACARRGWPSPSRRRPAAPTTAPRPPARRSGCPRSRRAAGSAHALEARERVGVEVVARVARPRPRAGGRSTPRWRQSVPVLLASLDRHAERRPARRAAPSPAAARDLAASRAPRRRASRRRRRRPRGRSRLSRPSSRRLDELEVVARRHLEEPRVARDDRDPSARPLDERRAVGRAREVAGDAPRAAGRRRTPAVSGPRRARPRSSVSTTRLPSTRLTVSPSGSPGRPRPRPPRAARARRSITRVVDERAGGVVDEHDERLVRRPPRARAGPTRRASRRRSRPPRPSRRRAPRRGGSPAPPTREARRRRSRRSSRSASSRSRLSASSGRPREAANAFGRSRRAASPAPAATRIAQVAPRRRRWQLGEPLTLT